MEDSSLSGVKTYKGKEGFFMKIETTMKRVVQLYPKVFRCGYCDLQNIFKYEEPVYYNCGVYGWNCDIYVNFKRDIAITTGYRNMRGERVPDEIIRKYDAIAREILKSTWEVSYDELKAKLDENRENFLNELDNL